MTEAQLHEKFEQIVTAEFGVPDDQYGREATFEAMGLDSLDLVELTLVVEEEFGARIEDEELEDIRTPEDAVRSILAKKVSA